MPFIKNRIIPHDPTAVQPGDDAAILGSGAAPDGYKLTADGLGGTSWEEDPAGGMTDAQVETAYNNRVSIVSQAEAEAGASTTARRWTAQRVAQAIAALSSKAWTSLTGTLTLSQLNSAVSDADLDAAGTARPPTAHTHDDRYYTETETDSLLSGKLSSTLKGAANGLAELDAGGLVPASQLPSYVDDVLSFANFAALPGTGETGKIYVTENDNLTYRWSGSAYVEISASLALGETSSTAYRGDRGKTAYDHSQATGNPHGTTKGDVGLGNVDNTSDANKPVSDATQTALNLKQNILLEGPFTDGDKTKLDGIEAGATADQTAGEIETLYEGQTDTNKFTDAEKTKLAGVESGATADQTPAEIEAALDTYFGNTNWRTHPDLSALALKSNVLEKDNVTAFTPAADYHPATKKYVDDNPGGGGSGLAVLQVTEGPYDKFTFPPLVISGTLTSDGSTPVAVGETLEFLANSVVYEDATPNWSISIDRLGAAGTGVNFALFHIGGATWFGTGAWGDWTGIVWTPSGTETGSPVLTPQITAGLAGQMAIFDNGTIIRPYINAVSDNADDERWVLAVDESYLESAYLTSGLTGNVYLDCKNFVSFYLDVLGGSVTFYLNHLRDGASFTIRGKAFGAAATVSFDSYNSVETMIQRRPFIETVGAFTAITEVDGALVDIAAAANGTQFVITGKIDNGELLLWTKVL